MKDTGNSKLSLYESVLDTLPYNMAILDRDGMIVETNGRWNTFGKENDLDPQFFEANVNYLGVCRESDDRFSRRAVEGIESVLSGERDHFRMEYPCHSESEKRWFIMNVYPFEVSDREYYVVNHYDITSRRQSEERSRRLSTIVDQMPVCVVTLRQVSSALQAENGPPCFQITNINPHAENVTGLSHKDILGLDYEDVFNDIFGQALLQELSEVIRDNENYEERELQSHGPDFEGRIWNLQVFNVTEGYVSIVFEDVTDTVRNRAQLEYLARYDELTELPNRDHFLSTLRNEMKRAKRYGNVFSLLLLDLDHFKRINDTYGHVQGDELLERVGEILNNQTRDLDTAGRYGGEEFGVFLPETPEGAACDFAERLREAIENIELPAENGGCVTITSSIGVSEFQSGDEEIKDVVRRADKVLYEAKETGRNRVVCWSDVEGNSS
jgi:diguanylate cyclase (GGDEF)-like protein/PAS domain S-box-containing protein